MKAFSEKKGILTSFDLKKARGRTLYIIMFAFLILALVVCFMPLVWIILSSFKDVQEIYNGGFLPDSIDFNKIAVAWRALDFTKYFLNSIVIVAGAVAAAVLLNGVFAFSLSLVKPFGHKAVLFIVMISLMVPSITSMVALFKNLVALKMVNNPLPLMLVFGANAFYLVMFKTYFDSLPRSVVESAQLDGCNKLQIFFRIVLPMCKSIIMVVAIFTVNAAWSDFMLPFLLLRKDAAQTIMVKLYSLNADLNVGRDVMLMAIVFAIIPPIVIFAIFQKQITNNVMASGLKE